MRRFLRSALPWVLCFGAGALFSVPYFFEGWFVLSFLSLGLFFYLKERFLKKKDFRAYLLFFLGLYLPLYSFLSVLHPLTGAGFTEGQSLLIVILACLLIPLIHAGLSALVMQFTRFLPEGPLFHALGVSSLWVVHEWLTTLGDFAFPWASVALSQTGFTPMLNTASFFGTAGIAFAVVFISVMIGRMFARGRILRSTGLAGLMLAVCMISGLVVMHAGTDKTEISVSIVQGNASTEEKWDTDQKARVLQTYIDMASEAAKAQSGSDGPVWIVLPESAVPANFTENGPLHQLYAGIASEHGVNLVAGVLRTDKDGVHNALVAVFPDGSCSSMYEKQHLVPFGEHLPFGGLLNRIFPSLGNFGIGGTAFETKETDSVVDIGGTGAGCYLCYDSVFPSPDRGQADVLLVLTNDSWFDRSDFMLDQHLRYARIRASETGKAVVRAANTGISAFIDRHGNVTAQTEKKTKTILTGTVLTNQDRTLYSRIGHAFIPVCGGLFLLLVLWRLLFRFRGPRT